VSGDGWNSMDGQPRFCAVCNKRILLNGEPVVFHTAEPKRSYHARCKKKQSPRFHIEGDFDSVELRGS
jgi:hypothetical protein